MSEILNLAEAFRQKSEKQAESIGQEVANEYKQHAEIIRQCLKESVSTLQDDITESHRHLKGQILKGWMWLVLSGLMLLMLAMSGLFVTGEIVTRNIQTIAEQNRTLKQLSDVQGLRAWREGDRLTLELPKGWQALPMTTSTEGKPLIFLGTKKALEK